MSLLIILLYSFWKKTISFKNLMTHSVKVFIIFASHTLNTIVLNVFPHWPTLIIINVSLKCSSVNVTENYFLHIFILFTWHSITYVHKCPLDNPFPLKSTDLHNSLTNCKLKCVGALNTVAALALHSSTFTLNIFTTNSYIMSFNSRHDSLLLQTVIFKSILSRK